MTVPATTGGPLARAPARLGPEPGDTAPGLPQRQAWESGICWPAPELARDDATTLRTLYRFARTRQQRLRVHAGYVYLSGPRLRGRTPAESVTAAARCLEAVQRAVPGVRDIPAMRAVRIPAPGPAGPGFTGLDLAGLAAVSAPALLLLLWSPEAAPRLCLEDGTLWLLSPARHAPPGSAVSIAAGLITALAEQHDLRPVSELLQFPALVKAAQEAFTDDRHYVIGTPAHLPAGRMSRLRGVGRDGATTGMSAQQALSMTVYATEERLGRLLRGAHYRIGVQLAHGDRALPIDAERGVRRPPVLVTPPAPAATRFRPQPLVMVVSPASCPPGGGTTDVVEALAGLDARPRALGWSHLRIARALARGGANVFVVPWYEIQFSPSDVWVHGPALRLRPDGTSRAEFVGPERPDSMVMYVAGGQGTAGSTPAEAAAAERLREHGIWPSSGSRQAVVARIMHAAGRRGVTTNVTGPEGAWWRKDRLEMALRWWTRQTGRTITRPETVVVSAPYVPLALEIFAARGWTAIVKTATGARAEGVHIVRPGEQCRRAWPRGSYVVQRLVATPYLVGGRKVDLRVYVLIDSAHRSRSRLLPLTLVRCAPLDWVHGSEVAEITNSSFKERLGLPSQIYPLDRCPGIPRPLRAQITRAVERLSDEMLDAVFAWRGNSAGGAPHARRVLIWGLDVLLQQCGGGVEPTLLEVNVYPQLFRGDRTCDQAVEDLLTSEMLPALGGGRPAAAAGRRPLVVISLLTTRVGSGTVRELTRACDRLGARLVTTSSGLVPGTLAAFHWGLDVPGLKRSLRAAQAACDRAGIRLLNATAHNKLEQVEILAAARVPVPETRLVASLFEAATEAGQIGFPVVLKPLNGSYSRGVQVIADHEELMRRWPGGRRLLQAFLPRGYRCARITVVGDEVVHGVVRVARDGVLATYDHGRRATLEPLELTGELCGLARRACRALAIDVGGVDVVLSERGPVVLEVNHRGVEFDLAELNGPSSVGEVARFLVEAAHARLKPTPVA